MGLPLALRLATHFRDVIGYDANPRRIAALGQGQDVTGETPQETLSSSTLKLTDQAADMAGTKVFIVAVPTPILPNNQPDLRILEGASESVGKQLSAGALVVYESTVYPGVTNDICVPILERVSGLTRGVDFGVGYSPERINPGDTKHNLDTVIKVISADTPAELVNVRDVYNPIVGAGLHEAPTIRVAEAAKVIENTQRDLNIALMNELALIFDRLGISTSDVLAAAGSKWNFLPFHPGLVGGHCIGVDPYYLTAKAEAVGYHPQVILAGRRINDAMGYEVARKTVKLLIAADARVRGARIGVLGATYKADVSDARNSRVPDIIQELEEFGCTTLLHDPLADPERVREEMGVSLQSLDAFRNLDAVIVAVNHREYKAMDFASWFQERSRPDSGVVVDLYGAFDTPDVRSKFTYWRL